MANDKDLGQNPEAGREEVSSDVPSMPEEPVLWTKKEKRRTIIEMIGIVAVIVVLSKYCMKFVSPFIQSLFAPLTEEEFFSSFEESPEDESSKTDMDK